MTTPATKSASPAEMAAAAASNVEVSSGSSTDTSTSSTSAQASAAVKLATASESTTASLTRFKALADAFIAIRSGSKETVRENGKDVLFAERSIRALSSLFRFVWDNQNDNQILNECRKLFIAHRDGYLSGEQGLQGMNYVSSGIEQNRLSIMYMLMYELTNPNRSLKTFDLDHASKVCQNPNCSIPNGFVLYVSSRIR